MNILPKKINTFGVIGFLLNVVFGLLIIYEVFFLIQLYRNLNTDKTSSSNRHTVRVDFKLMDQAISRYTQTEVYQIPPRLDAKNAFTDPFSNPVPIPSAAR